MSGSKFGKIFQVTTWGESHGPALGAIIDGCPSNIDLTAEMVQQDLDRRRPGQSQFTTQRQETDQVQILSGVFQGVTTGTPISLVIFNQDQRSHDYSQIANVYRPGHADYTYQQKYGIRDYRGGGRSSGRETAARVAAGAVARRVLAEFGIEIMAYTSAIGPIKINPDNFSQEQIATNPLAMPDLEAYQQAAEYLSSCQAAQDSAGGIIDCQVKGLPVGLGEPVFEKLDAMLAQAIFSIGAVKGFEIGSGIECTTMSGWEHNDSFNVNKEGKIVKTTNHAGGILGGISDGSPLLLRTHIKPTPSIHRTQNTVTTNGENTQVQIKGRHDPIIVPRAVVVVEAMTAITLVDYLLQSAVTNINTLKKLID